MGGPAIFLDRDGVLNRNVDGGYVLSFDSFEFNEPLLEVLAEHSKSAGTPLVIVTNQRCVARQLISETELRQLMGRFADYLRSRRVEICAWYCCPHTQADACICRKPAPGMVVAAAGEYAFDLSRSCMIGDSDSDLVAGARAGVGTCIKYCFGDSRQTTRLKAILEALYGG